MKATRCIVCSFVDGEGSAKIGHRLWRWEFHEYTGPYFTDSKGRQVKDPPEGHPVWRAFNDWLWEHYTAKKNKRALAAMSKWYTPPPDRRGSTVKADP